MPTQLSHRFLSTSDTPPKLSCISLSAGRERRISNSNSNSNSNNNNSAELKLLSEEEKARQKRTGQMKQRLEKSVRREDRISQLEVQLQKASKTTSPSDFDTYMTPAEYAELQGLYKTRDSFEEQYDPASFTKDHLEFKAKHNDAFIQLAHYCETLWKEPPPLPLDGNPPQTEPTRLFFLDGPDGGTAKALLERGGFHPEQCFVANRHLSSCQSLRISGGGVLPEEHVVHATASEALTTAESIPLEGVWDDSDVLSYHENGPLAHIDFTAYYFDACGGYVPHIIGMLSAALLRQTVNPNKPIAIGYSLLGGNKDMVQKELTVSRALTIIARQRGMTMVQALEDPIRYGLHPDIPKIGGANGAGTFTTWLLLRKDDTIM